MHSVQRGGMHDEPKEHLCRRLPVYEFVFIWFVFVQILKIIDVDNKGFASKDDIQALTLEQLKQMANVIDADPANTEEYEFALFDLDAVR